MRTDLPSLLYCCICDLFLDGFYLQPEMEMVARGLEKHLKMEQREFLMSMLVGICSEESQKRAAEALGLVGNISLLANFVMLKKTVANL